MLMTTMTNLCSLRSYTGTAPPSVTANQPFGQKKNDNLPNEVKSKLKPSIKEIIIQRSLFSHLHDERKFNRNVLIVHAHSATISERHLGTSSNLHFQRHTWANTNRKLHLSSDLVQRDKSRNAITKTHEDMTLLTSAINAYKFGYHFQVYFSICTQLF